MLQWKGVSHGSCNVRRHAQHSFLTAVKLAIIFSDGFVKLSFVAFSIAGKCWTFSFLL